MRTMRIRALRSLSAAAPARIRPTRRSGTPSPDGAFLEADDGVRTRDPQLGKLMLYQLSYVREASSLAAVL
jgi:hypothetical protein